MADIVEVYAAYSKDEKLRLASSSGAIFTLLSEQVLRQAGSVYGVSMSQDCKYAEFIRVDKQKDLVKLQGSKYLQARVGNIYKLVKEDLESGLAVLFSGTGCQVNGLKGFLGKEYENLYCVDVICHGVPSQKLWEKYVQYVEEKAGTQLIDVNFRCKDVSWSDFGIKKKDIKHNTIYASKERDPYMLMFLRNYCLRPSCYECVAKRYKFSDVTLADFWGIKNVLPKMNDGKGVSLVIARTSKGLELFNCIGSKIISKSVSYDDGIKENPAEYESAKRPEERSYFFDDMNVMDFEQLKNKYAVPAPISLKNKAKKLVKRIILKTGVLKLMGEVNNQTYGL